MISDTTYFIDITPQSPLNLTVILQLTILIISFILSLYIHTWGYSNRREGDRTYQAEFEFFKQLILARITEYLEHVNKAQELITKLLGSNIEAHLLKEYQQSTFSELESLQNKFIEQKIPLIECYSIQMSNEFIKATEQFFNTITGFLPEYSTSSSIKDISKKFGEAKVIYLKEIYKLVSDYKPTRRELKQRINYQHLKYPKPLA